MCIIFVDKKKKKGGKRKLFYYTFRFDNLIIYSSISTIEIAFLVSFSLLMKEKILCKISASIMIERNGGMFRFDFTLLTSLSESTLINLVSSSSLS
jgi:hypothetical protein